MNPSNPPRKATAKQFMAGANVKGTETIKEPVRRTAAPLDKTAYVRKPTGMGSGNMPQRRTPNK